MSDAIVSKLLRLLPANTASVELPTLSQLNRVLLIKPDEIGDVVLASPFLRELRRNLPTAWITLVVKAATFNLVERCPYLDEILVAPLRRTFGGKSEVRQLAGQIRFAKEHLWDRFDAVILLRSGTDENGERNLAFLSFARWRFGFGASGDRRLTHCMPTTDVMHESERMLQWIIRLGGSVGSSDLEVWTDDRDAATARSLPSGRLLALCIGAGAAKRRWPACRYAEVLRQLIAITDIHIVIVGSSEDRKAAASIASQVEGRVLDLTGKLSLRQTAEVLRRCVVYLGNDTGPMHLAAAVGCAAVVISCHPRDGSPLNASAPQRFGPRGMLHRVLQPEAALTPCTDSCDRSEPHCITLVTVDQVYDAVKSLVLPLAKHP